MIKAFLAAFSIYSKIPVPRFEWNSEDMKYHLCCFPWVGAVIGGFEWLWYKTAMFTGAGPILFVLICAAIPLLISGGFHMDGFMDTMDAIHSYGDRKKKLEILKDPHIGAFSVISLLIYMLFFIGFLSEITKPEIFAVLCFSFFLSRSLSAISVITLKSAKDDGMLNTLKETAQKNKVLLILIIQFIICSVLMIFVCVLPAVIMLAAVLACFIYYIYSSRKNFGGISGDLAGFFLTLAELSAVISLGIVSLAW